MSRLEKYTPQFLSLLRIMSGLLFLAHGTAKLLHFPITLTAETLHLSPAMFLASGLIELVGGTLITLGLFTRWAAFICSGQMAVAYFFFHARLGRNLLPIINEGELAVLFCFVFLFLAAAGAGPWSVDALRSKRRFGKTY